MGKNPIFDREGSDRGVGIFIEQHIVADTETNNDVHIGVIIFQHKGLSRRIAMAAFLVDLSQLNWWLFVTATILIATASTFLGLFIAVTVSEVFEAQTFSNFFRFPMIFLCGLFFPVAHLPFFRQPLAYALPLTYGADMLHGTINGVHQIPHELNLSLLTLFCGGLFSLSLMNIKRRWIV